jgi:cysteine desulfurase
MLAGACAVALADAQDDVEARAEKIASMRDFLFKQIEKAILGVRLNGAGGKSRAPNNLNITIPQLNGDMAVIALDAQGVAVSTRSACDTEDESPSYVLKALGISVQNAKNSIRITVLPGATKGEARRIARALARVVALYRQS